MEHIQNNPYNLFAVKQGDKFTAGYFKGIATVNYFENGIAIMYFDNAGESHRNGEAWASEDIEEKIRNLELHRLVSHQFRRKSSDGSYTRDYGFWEDMEEPHSWGFVCQFLPDYERRDDVMTSDDLACVIDKEKTLEWLYDTYPEWEGLSLDELKKVRSQWDYELQKEAEAYLFQAIQSGDIEVRELPVGLVSARIPETNDDTIWLQCADETLSNYGNEFDMSPENLQNVKCRWLNKGTDEEQFQIYYDNPSSGDEYWCNALSQHFI